MSVEVTESERCRGGNEGREGNEGRGEMREGGERRDERGRERI